MGQPLKCDGIRKTKDCMKVLRKLVFILLLSLLGKDGFSQRGFCIYIESLHQQPFYVRIGHETFTSGNGYLLVPGLASSTYDLIIGFQGSKMDEWRFACPIADKDLGLLVEDKGSAGVRLSRLDQSAFFTGTAVKPLQEKKPEPQPVEGTISNDPFSTLLAAVVNDPSIRMPVIVELPPVAQVVTAPAESAASPVASQPVDESKDLIAATPPPAIEKQTVTQPVQKQEENKSSASVSVKAQPETVVDQSAKSGMEKTAAKKSKAEEPKAENAIARAATASPAAAEKKYEPFVIKEKLFSEENKNNDTAAVKAPAPETSNKPREQAQATAKAPVPGTANEESKVQQQTASSDRGVDKDSREQAAYLPFVITPGAAEDAVKSVPKGSKPEAKSVSGKPEEKPVSVKEVEVVPQIKEEKPKAVLSTIRKTLERKGRDGVDLIYVDEAVSGKKDTIRIFVPALVPGK